MSVGFGTPLGTPSDTGGIVRVLLLLVLPHDDANASLSLCIFAGSWRQVDDTMIVTASTPPAIATISPSRATQAESKSPPPKLIGDTGTSTPSTSRKIRSDDEDDTDDDIVLFFGFLRPFLLSAPYFLSDYFFFFWTTSTEEQQQHQSYEDS